MDILEVRSIIRDVMWNWEKENLAQKDCPMCQKECTMIKVSVPDDETSIKKWRCLNCLDLFTEILKKAAK